MVRRRQAVTIKHVAADAGVSLQTVSRVINKEPNVRPQMQERVQASIDKLGYVPSRAAQRMSGSRSYLILALNDRERTIADWRARQGSDWVDQMLLGGMLKCAEYGYRMMFELVDTHNDHVERELSAAITALQPDGVILTPPHSDNPLIVNLLDKHNIPFARIGSAGWAVGIPLTMGDEQAGKDATQHLIDLGHEKVAFISGPDEYILSSWRRAGWQCAMGNAGLAIDGLIANGDFSFESGRIAAEQLLGKTDRPTAILASNDQMAMACLEVAREKGLVVPDDLSVVSFDNTPIVALTDPPLTAVDQPIAETTSRAVELIIAAKNGNRTPDGPIIVPAGFVERGSTAAPPRG
ncbi:LacI family DNA-binding transcriptional regulator [Pontixanthobacter aestiaquae]|uniref:LacI family DNA-binding transcriptional regulator n=1 Tax=Pontixanthobacter aestiaquae TaxID=1509367 RepID=A0A844Z4U5_9SPHN|nr:LacI family DNA-binding transcriptional regulator [Pontixanthobacter aestiaquae]MDN3647231.1 LacI family DNA-binding transcriptional regulator [Pontixanthobacter aestiaquae]MXO81793.1 LacI family DNA-binding transcriptional regulator [Pontixanthobacter aestiaquae]